MDGNKNFICGKVQIRQILLFPYSMFVFQFSYFQYGMGLLFPLISIQS